MLRQRCCHLAQDLLLPTLLFAALGGMTWAVRGSSGYGAAKGCIFAGVMWGAAWWFISRTPAGERPRRYTSAWIVLALTIGIGYSGSRGWMQWPSFFEGKLQTNAGTGEFVPIDRSYGFLWLFIAGVPWAGLGACLLAWCGTLREMRVWHWVARIAFGIGGAILARVLYDTYPQHFLPLYSELESRYKDLETNPNLGRLIRDSGQAIFHLGFYLGFLLFEAIRREWKNVVLITTVGVVNGLGWAACQNWKWAADVWPGANFNFWRCWESSGGISIGIAYGIAYFLVNRPMSDRELAIVAARRSIAGPNFEWLIVFGGLAAYLSLFLRGETRGWGPWYIAVALLFAGAYYISFRRTSANGAAKPNWTGLSATTDLPAMAFIALLVAGQFINPRRMLAVAAVYPAAIVVLALGWHLTRRRQFEEEKAQNTPISGDPNLERLGLWLGLLTGLGLSTVNGLKGWFNIYEKTQTEEYWLGVLWNLFGPLFLVALVAMVAWTLWQPLPRNFRGELFPRAHRQVWLVLIVQNVLAQLITGPPTQWNEMAFNIYYLLLFFVTGVIVYHYHREQDLSQRSEWAASFPPGMPTARAT